MSSGDDLLVDFLSGSRLNLCYRLWLRLRLSWLADPHLRLIVKIERCWLGLFCGGLAHLTLLSRHSGALELLRWR